MPLSPFDADQLLERFFFFFIGCVMHRRAPLLTRKV